MRESVLPLWAKTLSLGHHIDGPMACEPARASVVEPARSWAWCRRAVTIGSRNLVSVQAFGLKTCVTRRESVQSQEPAPSGARDESRRLCARRCLMWIQVLKLEVSRCDEYLACRRRSSGL